MHIFSLMLAILVIFLALTVIVDASTEHKQSLAYLGFLVIAAFGIAVNLHGYISTMSR